MKLVQIEFYRLLQAQEQHWQRYREGKSQVYQKVKLYLRVVVFR